MFEFIEMGFALYGIPHTETECGIGNLVWIILKRSLFDKFSLSLEAVAAGMIGQMGLDSSIILLQHYGLKEVYFLTLLLEYGGNKLIGM